MTVDCVVQTLNKAKMYYHIPEGMILHTDLGSQYTAREVEQWLETNKIRHSYSRKEHLMIMLELNLSMLH